MIPNPQAAATAEQALAKLSEKLTPAEIRQAPAAILARKIANRETLSAAELAPIEKFFELPEEENNNDVFSLANNLYGGRPMRHQMATAEPTIPKPKAVVYAELRPEAAQLLKQTETTKTDRIPLADLGHVIALTEMDKMQAEIACETLASQIPPVKVEARWRETEITASGHVTKVVYDMPDIYKLKHQLNKLFNKYGVPYSNENPWTPETVTAITAAGLPECIFSPFTTSITKIVLAWGDDERKDWELTPQEETVTAAAAPSGKPIDLLMADTMDELQKLDERWLTALEAIVEMAVNQAIEKVGRVIKKTDQKFADVDPKFLVVTAEADIIPRNVNVDQLIKDPIDDAVKTVDSYTRDHLAATQRLVGDKLNVDIKTFKKRYNRQLTEAKRLLKSRLKGWIKWRIGTPAGQEKLEDANTLISAPTNIVRDYAQVAGDDEIITDEDNIIKPARTKNWIPALASGPVGIELITKSVETYKNGDSSQYKIRETPGSLTPAQTATLAALTPLAATAIKLKFKWQEEYYGKPRTKHNPKHEAKFGDIVDDPLTVRGAQPGDTAHCNCAFVPVMRLEIDS